MSTQHEMNQVISDWLEERVVEPRLTSLYEAIDQTSSTPQARRHVLGRLFERDGGVGRRTADHDPSDARR